MAFPLVAEEVALHGRVLACDPLSSADVFKAFMDPIIKALQIDLQCDQDDAHDSAIDAVLGYLENPTRFDPKKGRLSTYLTGSAKHKALDRIDSASARRRREETYAAGVELRAADPKELMEREIEARQLWEKVETAVPDERDREIVRLIVAGERSTETFATVLGLTGVSDLEKRQQVKRHRDRLTKVLLRLGAKLSDADA